MLFRDIFCLGDESSLSACLFVSLSLSLSLSLCLSVSLSLSIFLFIFLSLCLCVSLSLSFSVCPSVSPNVAGSVEQLDERTDTESVLSFRRERPRRRESTEQHGETHSCSHARD